MAHSKEAAQVVSITIYPLKSCRGISVPEAALLLLSESSRISITLLTCSRLGQNAKLQQTFHMQRQGLTMANDYFSTLACLGWIVHKAHERDGQTPRPPRTRRLEPIVTTNEA
uniref:Uncharacterized protein n=1 Tax=Solanum lycopersicum TaxID=4081 RepID=A0A3Q7EDE1_SOLLC